MPILNIIFCTSNAYSSRFILKIHHDIPDTRKDITIAMANPHRLVSIPLIRFIPNKDAIRVGNIIIILTDVNVRITVFILLLIILE